MWDKYIENSYDSLKVHLIKNQSSDVGGNDIPYWMIYLIISDKPCVS